MLIISALIIGVSILYILYTIPQEGTTGRKTKMGWQFRPLSEVDVGVTCWVEFIDLQDNNEETRRKYERQGFELGKRLYILDRDKISRALLVKTEKNTKVKISNTSAGVILVKLYSQYKI